MYCETGLKLVQNAKRTLNLSYLPSYQTELVRSVTREIKELNAHVAQLLAPFQGSFDPTAEPAIACQLLVLHLSMRRNKRCMLCYHETRARKLQEMYWRGIDVLEQSSEGTTTDGSRPAQPGSESSVSPEEEDFFRKYNDMLSAYKGQWTDIDLTGALDPPKDLFVEIRCLQDAGEIQVEFGSINLTKNSQHYVREADVQNLITQGLVQRIG